MKLYQHLEHLWAYMQLHQELKASECLFVLGSHDLRVAEYAATLYHQSWANKILFSGGFGRFTEGNFARSEAETFAQVAYDLGVPAQDILIEDKATNTGENVQFSAELLKRHNLSFSSFILVQKPYMERRTLATFAKQWPASYQQVCVTSPKSTFCDYFNDEIDLDTTVRAMLGDFERIKVYPALGFQTEQEIPACVEHSYQVIRQTFS